MVYEFCKYPDETLVVFSDIEVDESGLEKMWIRFERPTNLGFDTIVFELPTYNITEKDGFYSDEEIEMFKSVVERGAASFYRWARQKGIKITK